MRLQHAICEIHGVCVNWLLTSSLRFPVNRRLLSFGEVKVIHEFSTPMLSSNSYQVNTVFQDSTTMFYNWVFLSVGPVIFAPIFYKYFSLKMSNDVQFLNVSPCTFITFEERLIWWAPRGQCSRHWFPMKFVSLVGTASSHNPSIPWASVSVYKEWFSNIKACEKTNRPKLRAL